MDVREKIALFPHQPGVYRYYDASGEVIYVGKAKDLHKRVAQYFVSPDRLNAKTRALVQKIADAQYSVVGSEADALLLENNLIKQYKPRYNILLKDSKTYPWICITPGPYPRIFLTRKVTRDGSKFFGPYSSVLHARGLLEFFQNTYPLRSCKYRIDSEAIIRRKYRPCLDYQIGKCLGCCVGGVSVEDYDSWISEIEGLLKHGPAPIVARYREAMKAASDALDFEAAQRYKERIDRLGEHYAKSVIVTAGTEESDVFSLVFDGQTAFGNFLRVRGGAIVQSLNLILKSQIEETQESVLSTFIAEMESQFGALSKLLVVPFLPDVEFDGVQMRVPQRGEKLSLLELSLRNAREHRFNSLRQREHSDPEKFRRESLEQLRDALGMVEIPEHIECFDNSNIQGTNPVAACVVFRGGVPSKKDYRKFKIKTVIGANDYASMKEVVNRRYSRMLEEAPEDLPQLIVIDGGKGQLAFAWQALSELGLTERLVVVGLAERMEEIIRVGDPYPLFLDRNSQAFKIVTHIRDEAHRFGITFHRSLRLREQTHSALSDIPGVGERTQQRLLMRFGSVARIASATVSELSAVVGPKLAVKILDKLQDKTAA